MGDLVHAWESRNLVVEWGENFELFNCISHKLVGIQQERLAKKYVWCYHCYASESVFKEGEANFNCLQTIVDKNYTHQLFDEMLKKNLAYWSSMNIGYWKWRSQLEAIRLLNMMSERNTIMWATIILDLKIAIRY